jgi:hypothetical protein
LAKDWVRIDVTDQPSIDAAAAEIGAAEGRLDVLGPRPNRNTWRVTTRLINDQLVNAPPAI